MNVRKLLRLTPQPTEQMEPEHYRPVEVLARTLGDPTTRDDVKAIRERMAEANRRFGDEPEAFVPLSPDYTSRMRDETWWLPTRGEEDYW